jgi:hypothetical protein
MRVLPRPVSAGLREARSALPANCLSLIITNSGRAGNGVVWRGYVNDSWNRSGIGWRYPEWRTTMARKSKLTRVAVGIGTAMGKADRGVQKVAKAGSLAKKELDDISKQVDALKRQLQKTAKRLKRALS